jgi:hypothetical protein
VSQNNKNNISDWHFAIRGNVRASHTCRKCDEEREQKKRKTDALLARDLRLINNVNMIPRTAAAALQHVQATPAPA